MFQATIESAIRAFFVGPYFPYALVAVILFLVLISLPWSTWLAEKLPIQEWGTGDGFGSRKRDNNDETWSGRP